MTLGGTMTKEDWQRKDDAIVKQNVLNRAVDMFIAGEIGYGEILAQAEAFFLWVRGDVKAASPLPVPTREPGTLTVSTISSLPRAPVPTTIQQGFINKIQAKYSGYTNEMIYGVKNSYPTDMEGVVEICKTLKP